MEYEKLFAALRGWGADPVEGVGRCMGDADLYVTCLRSFSKDKAFDALYEAQTPPQIMEAAHTLKGVTGNLSLTPMFELLGVMVAQIRAGSAGSLSEQTGRIQALQLQFQHLLEA